MQLNHSLPSPASSPSPNSADYITQPSRKRQRSQSMHSDTSSASVKRSVSEGNALDAATRGLQADKPSPLSVTDINQDIDSYMAEQGEADIPVTLSVPPSSGDAPPTDSPAEKVAEVDQGKSRPMQIGETWYLVSKQWWKRWRKACLGVADKDGPPPLEKDLGPVDNSELLDEFGRLKMQLVEGVDVEFVPSEIWSVFTVWYGVPIHPLSIRVIGRGQQKIPTLELYPPTFGVARLLPKDAKPQTVDDSSPKRLTISAGENVSNLCIKLAQVFSEHDYRGMYRVWSIPSSDDQPTSHEITYETMIGIQGVYVQQSSKTIEEAGFQSGDTFVVEFEQADGWILPPVVPIPGQSAPSLGSSLAPAPLFNSSEGFFNQLQTNLSSPTARKTAKVEIHRPFDSPSSITTGSSFSFGNRAATRVIEPGTLGLGNMGNTCFMNSALQCLAHTRELSDYFLSGVFEDELNPDNPLGMHGAIAEAFGALLQRVWAENSATSSYSPREFKMQLQRFAPQFSGYQQHDSQELVAFLLDGLHEDLNRVLKKPYVEKPDWEGGGDLELVQLAKKSWEGYMMRNDSVIVDLFQGQYQSTLVCPECEKVSITFDPFMYLTLPLPIHKKWSHQIYYVPWDRSKPHVLVPVELPGDASLKELRNLLGRWMEAIPENLLTLEVFNHRFYKYLNDILPVADVADNDVVVCFELPCNAQQSPRYKRQPDDPFLLPLFLSESSMLPRSTYMSSRSNAFGYPSVVVVTPEQAKTMDGIYDACVDRLQRWTDRPEEFYSWEANGEAEDGDAVPIQINGIQAPADSLTEITEDGYIKVQQVPQEDDITEERSMIVVDPDEAVDPSLGRPKLKNLGTKKGLFELRLQTNQKLFGTQQPFAYSGRFETWQKRLDETDINPILLRDGDAIHCEFDEHRKIWFFGDEKDRTFKSHWDRWTEFKHPEFIEAQKAVAEKKKKSLTLQDCLEEFTKEEKLGEDDLWYCPRCKKHQQATKRFDLWNAPDILVVHLKRFSNNRTLRDKIDIFIDFPIEGLDLTHMVGERAVAKRLKEQGVDVEELNLGDTEEPLIYDLYGVDEHIGGLGGGHYRAYAHNHVTDKWYHFDDSYVSPAKPPDAVNANAYLLFYRRRSSKPLGGKTQEKVEAAKLAGPREFPPRSTVVERRLPTPPNDDGRRFDTLDSLPFARGTSNAPSSPDDPHDFDTQQTDDINISGRSSPSFSFHRTPNQASPTSSNEAEADTDLDDSNWGTQTQWGQSPSPSNLSDPAADTTSQRDHSMDTQSPGHDETL
ncbi:hypothetical protein AX16_001701 [Volvariella volvacea WC 439]|nr:hypothetical protein AX16_001701 [Volvariella volvacea WC 439]